MIDVGIIGTGAIGSKVASHVDDGLVPQMHLTDMCNRTRKKAETVVESLESGHTVEIRSTPLAVAEHADVVVETASQTVLEESATDILKTGTDLIAMSVGAFRDQTLLSDVQQAADAHDSNVYVPSGAIAGLDGIGAIGTGSIERIFLTCYRPPEYLEPYVDEGVDVTTLSDGETIFEGNAAEAAAAFPAHMNVAIALTLTAQVPPSDVGVQIFVQRDAPRSKYVIEVSGEAGSVQTEIQNFKTNVGTETSKLTVFSVIEKLRRISSSVELGT
jgi:aspartate dehydrogenase